jgi:uncharacterized protein (TIGR03067 family)
MARARRARSVLPTKKDPTRLEDFWDEPAPSTRALLGDLEALQGAWTAISGRRQATFLISGNHFTVHFADGEIYMGCFTVGSNGRYRTMDVQVVEGPQRHKGQSALCIFELDQDVLRWCTASPGQLDRPGDFIEADPLHLCLVFRKHRPFNRQ